MCLYTNNQKPFVAKRNYIVYKYLRKEGNNYVTPFQEKIVRLQDTIKAELKTNYDNDNGHRIMVGAGFVHAVLREYKNYDIAFKAIIKKGTEFYIGEDISDICAREIFITDEVVNEFPPLYEVMKPIIEDFIDDIFETEEKSCGSYRLANGTYVSPKAIFKQTIKLNDEVIGVVNFIKDNTTNIVGLDERKLSWCEIEYNKMVSVNKNNNINAQFDYDGKKNTKDVVSHKTYLEENYPAFYWCNNYVTKGTNKGDWYIGGCGEVKHLLYYNEFKINVALLILQTIQNNVNLIKKGFMWSSSEHNIYHAWTLYTSSVNFYCHSKNNQHWVRPFAAF